MQTEEVIQKYLTGGTTPEEEQSLWDWINQSPGNRRQFYELKALWQARHLYGASSVEAQAQTERSLDKLNKRIDQALPVR